MTRYYVEGPCVHGEIREHRTGPYKAGGKTSWGTCAGVARRELTIDYRAAAIEWIGEKPPDNYPGEWEQMIQSVIEQTVQPIVNAALGAPV